MCAGGRSGVCTAPSCSAALPLPPRSRPAAAHARSCLTLCQATHMGVEGRGGRRSTLRGNRKQTLPISRASRVAPPPRRPHCLVSSRLSSVHTATIHWSMFTGDEGDRAALRGHKRFVCLPKCARVASSPQKLPARGPARPACRPKSRPQRTHALTRLYRASPFHFTGIFPCALPPPTTQHNTMRAALVLALAAGAAAAQPNVVKVRERAVCEGEGLEKSRP